MLICPGCSSDHILRSSEGESRNWGRELLAAPRGPGLLQPLPPAASVSRAVPFPLGRGVRATTAGSSQFCVLGFSVPGVTSVHAASAVLPGTSVLREDTWGGCWRGAPRPTKPHEIQSPGQDEPDSCVPKRLGCRTQGSVLSSSCCLTQRAASGLNVTSRRSRRGRAGAGHRPRFGWAGQLA